MMARALLLTMMLAVTLSGCDTNQNEQDTAQAPPVVASEPDETMAIAPPSAQLQPAAMETDASAAPAARAVPQSQAQVQLSYAPIVEEVAPAVVNVYATRVTEQRVTTGDPFFDQFFGNRRFSRQRPQTSQSLGSGVIVEQSGLILTNNHVVEGATDIRIVLEDGREYPVTPVLADAATDLAVLAVENADRTFPTVSFADSDQLAVGDLVLAIGNPFGVGQSVSSGIVSALARTGLGSSDYQAFIQTDAAINPGNSGGALVDMNGNLVGINTSIYSRSGGSQGIGFATPANMGRTVAQAAQSGGEIVRPWLGARLQALDSELAQGLGLEVPRGALIAEVAPDSPAARADLRSGDVITAINDVAVQDPETLNFRIATLPFGSTARLTLARDGGTLESEITFDASVNASGEQVAISGDSRFAGATAAQIDAARAQSLGLDFATRGVVITQVEPQSPAERMGLEPDDIILGLNGREIRDIETFEQVADRRPRRWEIVLQREGRVLRSVVGG